jgi:hypothetical protein
MVNNVIGDRSIGMLSSYKSDPSILFQTYKSPVHELGGRPASITDAS